MFVRFKSSPRRLHLSLVETRRVDGKVKHDHIASLGSIPVPFTTPDRLDFTASFNERISRLDNRITPEQREAIIVAIGKRIPWPTPEELKVAQIQAAKADAATFQIMADQMSETAAMAKKWAKRAKEAAAAKKACEGVAKDARGRAARLERGETNAGSYRNGDLSELLKFSASDRRHQRRLSAIHKAGRDEDLIDDIQKRLRASEKAASRALVRRIEEGR